MSFPENTASPLQLGCLPLYITYFPSLPSAQTKVSREGEVVSWSLYRKKVLWSSLAVSYRCLCPIGFQKKMELIIDVNLMYFLFIFIITGADEFEAGMLQNHLHLFFIGPMQTFTLYCPLCLRHQPDSVMDSSLGPYKYDEKLVPVLH